MNLLSIRAREEGWEGGYQLGSPPLEVLGKREAHGQALLQYPRIFSGTKTLTGSHLPCSINFLLQHSTSF